MKFLEGTTEHKRERINHSFKMWWSFLAPSSDEGTRSYGGEYDRFVYHMIYIGDLFGYFDEENSVKAKDYLSTFSLDQVYQMQYSAVTRSETQQIVVDLFKKVYPDLQEEVLIDRFYVVDIYIPSENLCLEVQGPSHYTYAGMPTKRTAAKTKVLQHLGYRVQNIDALQVLRVHNMHRDPERSTRMLMKQVSFIWQ